MFENPFWENNKLKDESVLVQAIKNAEEEFRNRSYIFAQNDDETGYIDQAALVGGITGIKNRKKLIFPLLASNLLGSSGVYLHVPKLYTKDALSFEAAFERSILQLMGIYERKGRVHPAILGMPLKPILSNQSLGETEKQADYHWETFYVLNFDNKKENQ